MARTIKVHILGRHGQELREVSLEEAEKILKETYTDSMGGLVVNRKTGEVISEIGPDVEELSIIEHMIGGG
jgi:hypothetical protein